MLTLQCHRSSARAFRSFVSLACLLAAASTSAEEVVKNWFKDPYSQVRFGISACPQPLGPYATHDQMLHETHYRSERGLRCYLEKKCTKPSSYMYDADIAEAVRSRFAASPKLKDTSLWVTGQRRFVWIEGCVASTRDRSEIEALMRGVPDLEMLIVNVMRLGEPSIPYRVLGPGQKRLD